MFWNVSAACGLNRQWILHVCFIGHLVLVVSLVTTGISASLKKKKKKNLKKKKNFLI